LQAQLLQAHKMESVGRLAGGVAHDFNNMLGVILGHAELALKKTDPAQPLYGDLQAIRGAAQRSSDLTGQLLAFARKQTVKPQVMDLNDTVGGMLVMLRRLIGENIELIWKPGANLWPVEIDPVQVDQILVNLSANARDAIVGAGRLIIETNNTVIDKAYSQTCAGLVAGEYVLLTVSDTGTGMDAETRKWIFEPFFTTRKPGKGTGLGLATIYGIVKQNKGFIYFYSEPGQGTTFRIYLPRARSAIEPKAATIEKASLRGSETILLVEDESAILDLCKIILEQRGYTVLTARTPGEALARIPRHDGAIDLLITDMVMPEMNGRKLKDKIAEIRPGLKTLYISGYTNNVIAHQGILEAEVQFLQKPFSANTLAAKVREVLDG
jgi:CheY-like chemotaxis protein